MKRTMLCLLLTLAVACGPEDTAGRSVEGQLTFVTSVGEQDVRTFLLPTGWHVTLEEAVVLLGPLYLRPPKRSNAVVIGSWLWPRAHAHGLTLTDGEVVGEYLDQVVYDVLGAELVAGPVASEAGPVDRVSLMIDSPRDPANAARTHGYNAYMRGRATRGSDQVAFACGLRIEATAQEMPKNLEARRRVDRIAVAASRPMDDGANLRVSIHPGRWFDFMTFEDFVGLDNACPEEGSAFALQWYLGMRRPEAFSAELN
jgi:hypothetical protein